MHFEDDQRRGALSRVLVPSLRTGGDHQSRRRIAPDARSGLPIARLPLAEDVGRAAPGIAATRIYSALLRVGFTMPPVSPPGRWALTPPFHPCLIPLAEANGGLSLCGTFHRPPYGERVAVSDHPALRSPDFASTCEQPGRDRPRPALHRPRCQRTETKPPRGFVSARTFFGIPRAPLDPLRATRPPASPASPAAMPPPPPPTAPTG